MVNDIPATPSRPSASDSKAFLHQHTALLSRVWKSLGANEAPVEWTFWPNCCVYRINILHFGGFRPTDHFDALYKRGSSSLVKCIIVTYLLVGSNTDLWDDHHRSLLSSRRMGPLILFLQATLSLTATSTCLQVLNPRCSLSLFTVLRHVSLGRPFLRLPSGAHVSAILGFLSDGMGWSLLI